MRRSVRKALRRPAAPETQAGKNDHEIWFGYHQPTFAVDRSPYSAGQCCHGSEWASSKVLSGARRFAVYPITDGAVARAADLGELRRRAWQKTFAESGEIGYYGSSRTRRRRVWYRRNGARQHVRHQKRDQVAQRGAKYAPAQQTGRCQFADARTDASTRPTR